MAGTAKRTKNADRARHTLKEAGFLKNAKSLWAKAPNPKPITASDKIKNAKV